MRKHIILNIIFFIALMPTAWAQYYAAGDTTYEYKIKGTVYANRFEGRKTSSGEVFRQKLYTGAHWKIKLGTLVLVSCPETGKQIIVKINDRCPTKGVIDLTRRAANDLGISGVKSVVVRQLPESYRTQWEQQTSAEEYATPKPAAKSTPPASRPKPPKTRLEDDEDEPQF
ncbi:MAG: septal ring lytic transglycosylase RlpA family protein [Bacteroidales bacterium]|nr:septal ring lytic transglycosylase RlpA family protein [Bacteroidales bacterium]